MLQYDLFHASIFSQMDATAVVHASDDLLVQLGLEQAGDRLSLKAFCARECAKSHKVEGEEGTEHRRSLIKSFLNRKGKAPKF